MMSIIARSPTTAMNELTASFLTFFHCSLCFSLSPASSAALISLQKMSNASDTLTFGCSMPPSTAVSTATGVRRSLMGEILRSMSRDLVGGLVCEPQGLGAGSRHLIGGERLRCVAIGEQRPPIFAIRLFKEIALRARLGEIVCFE